MNNPTNPSKTSPSSQSPLHSSHWFHGLMTLNLRSYLIKLREIIDFQYFDLAHCCCCLLILPIRRKVVSWYKKLRRWDSEHELSVRRINGQTIDRRQTDGRTFTFAKNPCSRHQLVKHTWSSSVLILQVATTKSCHRPSVRLSVCRL